MKANIILFLLTAFFVAGCTNNGLGEKQAEEDDTETNVRNAVMEYMEQEDWNPAFYTVDKWEHASVKKAIADERYKNLDDSYMGNEIFVVTIPDSLAAPLIFVDPETLEVIGIMPGE